MKKCLVIEANPNPLGFTKLLLESFFEGMNEAGIYEHTDFNVFSTEDDQKHKLWWKNHVEEIKQQIVEADLLVFAFPLWWEMPPYALVEFFQTIFVKDFAYSHDGTQKKNILDVMAINLITMGQEYAFDSKNLGLAMKYCGIKPRHCIFTNIGPRLDVDKARMYFQWAKLEGLRADHRVSETPSVLNYD